MYVHNSCNTLNAIVNQVFIHACICRSQSNVLSDWTSALILFFDLESLLMGYYKDFVYQQQLYLINTLTYIGGLIDKEVK